MVPLFKLLPSPSLRAIVLAPVYSMVLYVVLSTVDIGNATILFGLVLGLLLTPFMPWLFPISVVSGILAEFSDKKGIKAVIFPAVQFPLMFLVLFSFSSLVSNILWVAAFFIVGIILGGIGVGIAREIAPRIQKAIKKDKGTKMDREKMGKIEKNVLTLYRMFPDIQRSYNSLVYYYWVFFDGAESIEDIEECTPSESITRAFRSLKAKGKIKLSPDVERSRRKEERDYNVLV